MPMVEASFGAGGQLGPDGLVNLGHPGPDGGSASGGQNILQTKEQWQTSEGQLRLGEECHQEEFSGLVTEVDGAENRFDFESLLNGAPPTWQTQSPGWMKKRNAETNSCNEVWV